MKDVRSACSDVQGFVLDPSGISLVGCRIEFISTRARAGGHRVFPVESVRSKYQNRLRMQAFYDGASG
jgi:hypothetical protein